VFGVDGGDYDECDEIVDYCDVSSLWMMIFVWL